MSSSTLNISLALLFTVQLLNRVAFSSCQRRHLCPPGIQFLIKPRIDSVQLALQHHSLDPDLLPRDTLALHLRLHHGNKRPDLLQLVLSLTVLLATFLASFVCKGFACHTAIRALGEASRSDVFCGNHFSSIKA